MAIFLAGIMLVSMADIKESDGMGPEKIRVENFRISSFSDDAPDAAPDGIFDIKTGQQTQIAADIKNVNSEDQDFVFVLQIQDEGGKYVFLSWLNGIIPEGRSLPLYLAWYPQSPGVYTAEVLVFESNDAAFSTGTEAPIDPSQVIAQVAEIKIRVSGASPVYEAPDVEPLMSLENFGVVDSAKNTLDRVTVGSQIHLAADITNMNSYTMPFAYLVQIQDEDGAYLRPSWLSGSIAVNQSLSVAISWTPESPGIYSAKAYVFESAAAGLTNSTQPVDSSLVIAPILDADITVEPATSNVPEIETAVFKARLASFMAVDGSGNLPSVVIAGSQIHLAADITGESQPFAYIVQIRDQSGTTVHLSWSVVDGGPAVIPWTPTEPGTYTATAFVWKSLENPTPLSLPAETTITVT